MLAPSRLLPAAEQPAAEDAASDRYGSSDHPAASGGRRASSRSTGGGTRGGRARDGEPGAAEMPPEPEVAESFEEFVGQYPDEQYLTHQRRAVPALAGHPLRLVGPEHLRLAVWSRRVAGAEGVVAVL